jgi:zinc and cadmium transporter
MPTLAWIIAANAFGAALSVGCAALFALAARAAWIPALISYAVGALLGATFLEILPHALDHTHDSAGVIAMVLIGIVLFFILEKLVIWRHYHHDDEPGPEQAHDSALLGRSGLMILLGNAFHNLVDGIIIAAAFLSDWHLGAITAVAIFAHEIPQQVGDFVILLHSGYTRRATVVGGALAYFALKDSQRVVPYLLGIAAASMIYVAVADLMPGLHRRSEMRATVQQVALIVLGIGSIWMTDLLLSPVH